MLIIYMKFQHPIWISICIIAALLHVPLPAYGLGKHQRMATSLTPYTLIGDPDEATVSWLWHVPDLSLWEVTSR